jgi:hypothetical protein
VRAIYLTDFGRDEKATASAVCLLSLVRSQKRQPRPWGSPIPDHGANAEGSSR